MRKRKIILFSTYYPYGRGETFLHNELLSLQKDFDIEVFPTLKKRKNDTVRSLPDGIKYHEPFLNRSYITRVFKGIFNFSPLLPYLKDLFTLVKNTKNVKYSLRRWFLFFITSRTILSDKRFKELLKNKKDTSLYFYWGNFPVDFIKEKKVKIYMRVHGGEVNFERHFGYIPLINEKYKSNRDIVYLPISYNARENIMAINPKAKCVISRLGVSSFGISPDPKDSNFITIVSCSNMVPKKRIHLIIEALNLIKEKNILWIHFGDGPLMQSLENKANKLGNNIRFDFKGRLENRAVLRFYKENKIDLFVNVSETEGVPVSIMEAMSCGIPCFATNVGGTNEILNETGGRLVPKEFEVQELAFYISKIRETTKELNLRNGAYGLWKEKCQAEKNYSMLRQALGHKEESS